MGLFVAELKEYEIDNHIVIKDDKAIGFFTGSEDPYFNGCLFSHQVNGKFENLGIVIWSKEQFESAISKYYEIKCHA